MSDDLQSLLDSGLAAIAASADARALDALRVELLGKKGRVTDLLKQLASLQGEERKAYGERVNRIKQQLSEALTARQDALNRAELEKQLAAEALDVTLPGRGDSPGGLHPITRTIQRIEQLKARRSRTTSTTSTRSTSPSCIRRAPCTTRFTWTRARGCCALTPARCRCAP
jgi:phenylalanyl-tRNA synthetase alpha chain